MNRGWKLVFGQQRAMIRCCDLYAVTRKAKTTFEFEEKFYERILVHKLELEVYLQITALDKLRVAINILGLQSVF